MLLQLVPPIRDYVVYFHLRLEISVIPFNVSRYLVNSFLNGNDFIFQNGNTIAIVLKESSRH